MKKITILGSSWINMGVFFDVCYEASGITLFSIYKNLSVEGSPAIEENPNNYSFSVIEPGEQVILGDSNVIFGVTGPWGKYSVFNYFQKNQSVDKEVYKSIIHPSSYVAPSSKVQKGSFIWPNVTITSQVEIGFGVSIKNGVNICHHSVLGDYSEINPGAIISGGVKIGKGTIIGSGAVLKDGITIGANTVIGMGSVVTKDIPDGVVAFGNPCKVVRENNKERFL